jgi:hypothetical protein
MGMHESIEGHPRARLKRAELAAGVGAGAVGMGLRSAREQLLWWEMWLYRVCWALLAGLFAHVLVRPDT